MELQNLPWYGQFLVFLVIGGIIFGIFYFVYYTDKQKEIARIQTEIDKVEREIKKAEQKQDKLKQIREEIEAKRAVLEKLKEILPGQKEIARIIKDIQAILSEAKLNITKWTTQGAQRREIYIQHPIAINIEGNYHNLGVFFDQLSKLKKIFLVNRFSIRPRGTQKPEFTINSSFVASTYTYIEKKATPSKRRGGRRR